MNTKLLIGTSILSSLFLTLTFAGIWIGGILLRGAKRLGWGIFHWLRGLEEQKIDPTHRCREGLEAPPDQSARPEPTAALGTGLPPAGALVISLLLIPSHLRLLFGL